jgi:hypothetical protein
MILTKENNSNSSLKPLSQLSSNCAARTLQNLNKLVEI